MSLFNAVSCPEELNILFFDEPEFDNSFNRENCSKHDCHACWSSAIVRRDMKKQKEWLESFNINSATECFSAVQELKKKVSK